MTIVFFARLFYPHIGGVETHVFEISKLLVKRGHKVTVITEKFDKKLTSKDNVQGIKIYRIDVGRDTFKKLRIWRELLKFKGTVKEADIVHCHDVFFWYLPFRFMFPKKSVFITFHGYETKFQPSKKAIFVRKLSEKLAQGNICVGDYIKKWYGTRPDFVTYGGIKVSSIKYQVLSRQNDKLRILFVGRLEKDNGIDIYLKALEILKKRGVRFEFEVVGDGTYRNEVEKYGKTYGFTQNIREYIRKANMVFASSYLSIFEAMVAKKPVFAVYNNPLKKDYLEMTPFSKYLIISGRAENLVNEIENLKKRDPMVKNAYEWVSKNTWQNVLDKYLELWKLK